MSLFLPPVVRATDANANALSGAKRYFYVTETLDPAPVYQDADLETEHTNPVVADSGGLFPAIYYDPSISYRVIERKANGDLIQDVDPYNGSLLNSEWLTPWMFGAVGDYATDRVFGGNPATWEVVDNRAAIQALLDYVAASDRKVICDLRGNWGLSANNDGYGLRINQPRDNSQIFIGGTFVAMEEMTSLIYAENFRNSQMWGTLALLGTDVSGNLEERAPYADRLAKHGLMLENSNRAIFHEIITANTKSHGITDNPSGPGNNIHLTIHKVRGTANGSWPFWADQYAPSKTFSTRVDAGNDGNPNQSAVLGGISDTSDFEVGSFAYSTDLSLPFYIKEKAAGSLTIYPWPAHSLTTGTLVPMHGAALSLVNNDNTGALINQLDAFYAGEAAVVLAGLYGAQILDLQAQFCSAAAVIGKAVGAGGPNTCRGARIGRLHDESNEFSIIQVSSNSWWDVGEVAVLGHGADTSLFQRTLAFKPRFAATTLSGIENYQYGLVGHIRIGASSNAPKGFWTNGRIESSATYTNGADGRPYHLHIPAATNHTINLHCDEHINSKYQGCHVVHFVVTGTGSAGQPTGTITIQPTSAQTTAGYTVNAGASVALSNLPQFAHIICSRDPGSLNWTVSWSGRNMLRGSAVYDPGSLALGASTAIQTMTITGLVAGDALDSYSFSNNLAGARVHAWCSATNTASYYFTNENGTNPLDLASGTLKLWFRRDT